MRIIRFIRVVRVSRIIRFIRVVTVSRVIRVILIILSRSLSLLAPLGL